MTWLQIVGRPIIRDDEERCVQLLKDRFGSRWKVRFEYAGTKVDDVDGKTDDRCSSFRFICSELVVELVALNL